MEELLSFQIQLLLHGFICFKKHVLEEFIKHINHVCSVEIPKQKSLRAHAGSGVFVQSAAARTHVLESVNHLLYSHTFSEVRVHSALHTLDQYEQ